MPKKSNLNFDSFQLFSPLLLIMYLCIGFIPNLEAVDKIAPQWQAMNILNLISFITFYTYRKNLSKPIISSLFSGMSISYIGFILWAGFSYFYAINPTEVLVNITRQTNVIMMFLSMGILLYNMKSKRTFVCWVIITISGIEIYYVLIEALEMINTTGFITPGNLKGVTANRNITAFSLAIKIPFILYLINSLRKKSLKIALIGLIFLMLVGLSMIQSRAAFISVALILISYTTINIYLFFIEKNNTSRILQIGSFLLPLTLAIILNQTVIADKGADAISRASTISLSTDDGSVNQRLRYYSDVLTHMKSNPIFGIGLGNWKIKSIDYDSQDIVGYIVPYHAHSDFIQLGAELGIIGFLLYLSVFLWGIYYVYILIRFSRISVEEKIFLFLMITALGVYSIDANLNFPIARPQALVVWTLIMALIMIYYQQFKLREKKINTNSNIKIFFLFFSFTILSLSLYITNSVYKSLKGQMFLLQDFNSNQYNIPINQIDTIVPEIPNITVTTIPINSIKARYYFNAGKYEKALALLEKGTLANPYLFYSEILKSQIFEQQGKLDSAKVYAKKAFIGLPNNDLHASRYINLIGMTRDGKSLDEAFELLTIKNNLNNWKNYLIIASNFKGKTKDLNLIERANKALKLFPQNDEIKRLHNKILIGEEALNQSVINSNKGLEYFNKKEYQKAAIEFEKALTFNPLESSHHENAATANYLSGNLNKAIEQIDKVINEMNPLNGKCEYIKALIYIRLGDPVGACPFLKTALDSGHNPANEVYIKYCNQ